MASGAAAAIARARRDIQHEFFSHDAVRSDRAIAFDPSRHVQRRIFNRWQQAGVIREESPGRYWLDVVAYDIDLRKRHRRLRFALLFIIGLLTLALISGTISADRHAPKPSEASKAVADK